MACRTPPRWPGPGRYTVACNGLAVDDQHHRSRSARLRRNPDASHDRRPVRPPPEFPRRVRPVGRLITSPHRHHDNFTGLA